MLYKLIVCVVFNDASTTGLYTYLHPLSLHDALPILQRPMTDADLEAKFRGMADGILGAGQAQQLIAACWQLGQAADASQVTKLASRSEEHTSELQSLMRISYAVFCLKKKTLQIKHISQNTVAYSSRTKK